MLFTGSERFSFEVRESHEVGPGERIRRDGCEWASFRTGAPAPPSLGWVLKWVPPAGPLPPEKALSLGVTARPLFERPLARPSGGVAGREDGFARGGPGAAEEGAGRGGRRERRPSESTVLWRPGRRPGARLHLRRRRVVAGPGDLALHHPRGGVRGRRGSRGFCSRTSPRATIATGRLSSSRRARFSGAGGSGPGRPRHRGPAPGVKGLWRAFRPFGGAKGGKPSSTLPPIERLLYALLRGCARAGRAHSTLQARGNWTILPDRE